MRITAVFTLGIVCVGCAPFYDIMTVPPPVGGAEIPVKSDLFLAIDARINDFPVEVLLDTGTVLFNLVPPSAIERFGLKPSGTNPYAGERMDGVGVCGAIGADSTLYPNLYTAETLTIGGIVIENTAFVVLDEADFSTFNAAGVDCILNGALLTQVDWRVDQQGRRLTLFPLNSLEKPALVAELKRIGPDPPLFLLLQNAARIGGMSTFVDYGDAVTEPVETLMDTGGGIEMAVGETLFAETGWNLDDLPHINAGLFAAGGSCSTTRFRAPLVSLGDQAYHEVHAVMLPQSEFGLIGWRFLANHEQVNVAPGNGWIEFKKGADTDDLFAEPFMTFGFEVALKADFSYRVKKVSEGSEAEARGVVVDDIVRAVNGIGTDTLEGKSLLFGPEPMREGSAVFTFENGQGIQRDIDLPATPLL